MNMSKGMDIGHFKSMHEGRVVDVGVKMDHVQGIIKGTDHREADSVVPTSPAAPAAAPRSRTGARSGSCGRPQASL